VLITTGSQQGLDLVGKVLIDPGSQVAVESPTYLGALQAFAPYEAEFIAVEGDDEGPLPQALAAAAGARFMYLLPNFQNPSGRCLSAQRRLALVDAALTAGLPIVEDNPYGDLWFDAPPPPPLSAAAGDSAVYLGSFSKVLAPGLRLGFVAAPSGLIETLGAVRFHVDRHGDTITERAVAELIEDGEVARHARRMRRVYHARRDAMVASLTRHLGSALCFDVPAGGMALWAEASPEIDTRGWLARAPGHGVAFTLGTSYLPPDLERRKARQYQQFLRLGFARYDERELETAVQRMARALRA